MARNKKVEILSNDGEVLHPMTDGDCVIFEDGQTLTQKLSEDDSVKYTPEIVNSNPMFKVGEGDTVDYSDNVLDGAYERATLQGQTYVNYIQESSADEVTLPTHFDEYGRTQHKTLTSDEGGTLGINLVGQSYVNALQHDSEESYVVLGESLEFQEKKVEYTNEGQIKSAMLKGQTLVNLGKPQIGLNKNGYAYQGTSTACVDYGEYIRYIPNGKNNVSPCIRLYGLNENEYHALTQPLKPNTQYIAFMKLTLQGNGNWNAYISSTGYSTNGLYSSTQLTQGTQIVKMVFTTPTEFTRNIYMGTDLFSNTQEYVDLYWFQLFEYQEGMENWDIPYFEGMQSVTVSTKLENLCQHYNLANPKVGKTFTVGSSNTRVLAMISPDVVSQVFKPNTKYLIQFQITDLVLDGLSRIQLIFSNDIMSSSTNLLFGTNTYHAITGNGIYRKILTSTDLLSTSNFTIKGISEEWENSDSTLRSLTISNIMCIEYQNGMENWDLPYFEDYQVMKPVQVESVNKNIFTTQTVLGTYDTTYTIHDVNSVTITGTDDTTTYKNVKFLINVKPNTVYKISCKHEKLSGETTALYDVYSVPKNGEAKKYLGGTVINSGEYTQLEVRFYVNATEASQNGTIRYYDMQMEEGNTTTSYVPHQSKTTYSWDEVILRKIGDVEDTLDLTTGEWVQRIGEIVFDGSDDEVWGGNNSTTTTTNRFIFSGLTDSGVTNDSYSLKQCLCDKLQTTMWSETSPLGVTVSTTMVFLYNNSIDYSVSALRTWLQSNPIIIQYVLATPIVHKVNLSRPNLQVYDDITHVHTKCLDGTLIPNIYLPSSISYPAMLEPSKKYNVCINHTEVNADNPLKVNVGGTEITMTDSRMTLTTPTTLAHSNVLFTGKGNKIKESMLIKNSSLLTGDLLHFNGIGSVQLGKTIENLCSGKYERVGSGDSTQSETDNSVTITVTKQGSVVRCFELTTLLENGKKYFVYCPSSITTTTANKIQMGFQRTYNGAISYLRQPAETSITQYRIDQVDNQYTHLTVGCHGNLNIGDAYTIQRPIICEYEQGMENWDWESIGYFTGTKNIGNEFMRVQNKNLFDGVFELDTRLDGNGQLVKANGILSSYFKLDPSKQYYVSGITDRQYSFIAFYDSSYNYISRTSAMERLKFQLYPLSSTFVSDSTKYFIPKNTCYAKLTLYPITGQTELLTSQQIYDLSKNIQIEESSTATTYTAQKYNGLYITKDQPINLTWEQGQVLISSFGDSYTSAINNTLTTCVRNKGLLNLKPNTTYRVSFGGKTHFKYNIGCFDNNDCAVSPIFGISTAWIENTDTIFTTTKNMHKIAINVSKINDAPITPSQINHVRLEEVTEVQLRYCSGRHDELDITRGVYTQKVGMIYLDGTNTYSRFLQKIGDSFQPTDTTLITFDIKCPGAILKADVLCNRFPPRDGGIPSTDISFESACIHSTNESCRITIKKSKASTLEGFKAWLVDNPLTILYPLATPIIHKVHIGNKNEANTEVTKPNDVFTLPTLYTEQTHIDLTNNGIIPKVQSRDYIAYPIIPMIGRTYALQHNLTGGVSNLTVDLLGRTQSVSYQNHKSLVYTPETMDAILHNELRISGKGKISRVTYIDGGYMDRDIPYIEGMKNAVNPIVKNIGKNLVQRIDNIWYFYDNVINYGGTSHNCGIAPVKPYTQYIINKDSILCFYDENGKCTNSPFQYFYANRPRTAPSGSKYMLVRHKDKGEDDATYLDGLQVVEYGQEFDNQEYKENICYVDCGEIRLTPDMFEQGNVVYNSANTGATYESMKTSSNVRVRVKELIKIKPNTKYVININSNYKVYIREFDTSKGKFNNSKLSTTEFLSKAVFTTSENAQYISLLIGKITDVSCPINDFNNFNLWLAEENNVIVLRSLPNGVCDEIDLETGTYIQRIGEIVLDGSSDESWTFDTGEPWTVGEYYTFKKPIQNERIPSFNGLVSQTINNKYPDISYQEGREDGVGCFLYSDGGRALAFRQKEIITLDDWKIHLQSNPITVQYLLAEPVVKDIVIHNYPHSYEGGHVIIENGDPNTPIPAQLTYRAVTNRSGQIQQHTEQVEKQEREINELETLILENIRLGQNRTQQYSTNLSTISLDVEEEE